MMTSIISLVGAMMALAVCVSGRPDKVVCYYGSWAVYRPGGGRFAIESMDPFKCTHAIYSFVGINADASIRIMDAWNDIELAGLRRFNELKRKNPNLKTLIAIGGWNEGSLVFSQVASNSGSRQRFARNALAFIQTHGFDGFDLDWEYPAQRGGAYYDKRNAALMVEALRKTFDATGRKYLVTAAVAATASAADISYDIPAFSANLDFIHLMAYDFHGYFDGRTGHNAPLYSNDALNVDAAVKAWISRGAPANKIILGLAVYGHSFTVSNTVNLDENHGLNIPANAGAQGPYTGQEGMLGYNEICLLKGQGGWVEVWDDKHKVPAMYKGNQWVSFDNERSIRAKVEYALQMNLGGAMIWSIDTEDISGVCERSYSILSTINEVLFGSSNSISGSNGSGSGSGNASVSSTVNPLMTTTTTTVKEPNNERKDCPTNGYIRSVNSCNIYHYCENSVIRNTLNCPPGLVFNNDLAACDWPFNVAECS